jgi:hypothetical protein
LDDQRAAIGRTSIVRIGPVPRIIAIVARVRVVRTQPIIRVMAVTAVIMVQSVPQAQVKGKTGMVVAVMAMAPGHTAGEKQQETGSGDEN